jgi:hypothetical protein
MMGMEGQRLNLFVLRAPRPRNARASTLASTSLHAHQAVAVKRHFLNFFAGAAQADTLTVE